MNEEHTVNHLDYLYLLQQAKAQLSVTSFDSSYLLNQKDSTLFLSGKRIPFAGKIKEWVSPILIEDIEKNIFYPLFFLKSILRKEKSRSFLLKGNELPVFNEQALDFLTDNKIDVTDFSRINDLASYVLSLSSAIELAKANNKVRIVDTLLFFDNETLLYNAVFRLTSNSVHGKDIDPKFQGLFADALSSTKEDSNVTNKPYFFQYQEAINKLNSNIHCSKVVCESKEVQEDFILNSLNIILPRSESILFLVKDEKEKKQFKIDLSKKELASFFFDLKDFSLTDFEDLFREHHTFSLTIDERKRFWNFRENTSRYLGLLKKRDQSTFYQLLGKQVNDVSSLVIHGHPNNLNLDLTDYNEENYHSDYTCLSLLRNLPSVLNSTIGNHPFFGLSVSGKKDNYESLMVTIKEALSSLNDFMLATKDLTDIKGNPITSFKDFKEYGKDIQILIGYNGFPKKYFTIDGQDEKERGLLHLKSLYQSVSSTRLLINNLCSDSIYKADIRLLLNDLKNPHFLVRHRTKKILISYFKVQKNADINTLARILNTYITSMEELKAVLPSYITLYGDSVTTMNGVVEIESNMRYLKAFSDRKIEEPAFNLNNPFIKKCFKDKEYKNQAIQSYQAYEKLQQEVKMKMNAYIGYFLDDPKSYQKMNYVETIKLLEAKTKYSYDEFSQYAQFINAARNSSMLLQLTMKKYQANNKALASLPDDFLYSVFKKLYDQGQASFSPYQEQLKKYRLDYDAGLFGFPKLKERLLYARSSKLRGSIRKTVSFSDNYQRLLLLSKSKSLNYEDENTLLKLIGQLYPLIVACPDDLAILPDKVFNYVFIVDSSRFSLVDLISSISSAKKVLFVDSQESSDNRTFGYQELSLNYANLYGTKISNCSISKDLTDLLIREGQRHALRFTTKEKVFPYMFVNTRGKRIAVLPDYLVPDDQLKETYTTLREFLMRNFSIPLLILNTYDFLFNPSLSFTELLKTYGQAKKLSHSDEMSFYSSNKMSAFKDNEQLYLDEIQKIKSSFRVCLSKNQFQDLINHRQYEDAFYGIQPVRKELIDKTTNNGFKSWLDYQTHVINLIIEKGGFYMDISLEKIDFKKSDTSIRSMAEISEIELMQGIKAFVYSFEYFEEEELRSILSSLVGYDANDPEFSLRFDDVIETMLNNHLIQRIGDRLFLKLS